MLQTTQVEWFRVDQVLLCVLFSLAHCTGWYVELGGDHVARCGPVDVSGDYEIVSHMAMTSHLS